MIFCITLFFYLHIFFHLKTSDDLEIYTIEQPSKDRLEEICDLKQPVIFSFENDDILNVCNLNNFKEKYGIFDMKVRNLNVKGNGDDILYLPLSLDETLELFGHEDNHKMITENNQEFLKETGAIKFLNYNDIFLRPPLVSKCMYDIMSGSELSYTPLRYEINYRNYFFVTEGKITVKLIPNKYKKYLNVKKDYENFEFRSNINPWDVQSEHKMQYSKIKALDVEIQKGSVLCLPPYWLYSIRYDEPSTCIGKFQYRTYMNTVSIFPELFISFLQNQNIKYTFSSTKEDTPKKKYRSGNNIIHNNNEKEEIINEMLLESNEILNKKLESDKKDKKKEEGEEGEKKEEIQKIVPANSD